MISGIYNVVLRILLNIKFKDISCGARLISRKILKKVKLTTNSPFIGAELAIKSKYMGFKIAEVGIHSFPNNFRPGSSIILKNILITIRDIIILFFKIFILRNLNK